MYFTYIFFCVFLIAVWKTKTVKVCVYVYSFFYQQAFCYLTTLSTLKLQITFLLFIEAKKCRHLFIRKVGIKSSKYNCLKGNFLMFSFCNVEWEFHRSVAVGGLRKSCGIVTSLNSCFCRWSDSWIEMSQL